MDPIGKVSRFVDDIGVKVCFEDMAAVLLWNATVFLTKKSDNNSRQKKIISNVENQMEKAGIKPEIFNTIKEWVKDFIQGLSEETEDENKEILVVHERIYNYLQDNEVKIVKIEMLED